MLFSFNGILFESGLNQNHNREIENKMITSWYSKFFRAINMYR